MIYSSRTSPSQSLFKKSQRSLAQFIKASPDGIAVYAAVVLLTDSINWRILWDCAFWDSKAIQQGRDTPCDLGVLRNDCRKLPSVDKRESNSVKRGGHDIGSVSDQIDETIRRYRQPVVVRRIETAAAAGIHDYDLCGHLLHNAIRNISQFPVRASNRIDQHILVRHTDFRLYLFVILRIQQESRVKDNLDRRGKTKFILDYSCTRLFTHGNRAELRQAILVYGAKLFRQRFIAETRRV